MISLETARQLLDFRGLHRSISEEAAEEQLRGAVAVHNLLATERFAYLADEVGMGKTYVALGAVALFRHYHPGFRLLVIAPRENIQDKWVKELRNFTRANFRFSDLRVRSLQGAPARAPKTSRNLVELVREVTIDPDRDFFLRLTSFSLPLGKDAAGWRFKRDELLEHLPWAHSVDFDLRSRATFKDNFARAVCCALPKFDLVIVDEGHNLKHGFGEHVSARNRVLALALGHPAGYARGFPGYGRRAERVLLLSATPLENDYRQLWNQLDVLGFGDRSHGLADASLETEQKRELARRFLIRRVTSIRVGGDSLTKNLYRREWRAGGVASHDLELKIPAQQRDRQRLIVALVQKKVSELLGHERFNNSFQIGMLASFESFLQTAKVAKEEAEDGRLSVFDDPEQADDNLEREGLDVHQVNRLAESYRRHFNHEMPHPKMDALVEHLAAGLALGRKALVFVRRVASVKELQAKLEERYDQELFARLRRELPELSGELEKCFERYLEDRRQRRGKSFDPPVREAPGPGEEEPPPTTGPADEADEGGLDSFFAWFFRGEGPGRILSGAALQRRLAQASSAYSTLFEDNATARLLGVAPAGVLADLARRLGADREGLAAGLRRRAGELLPTRRKDASVGRLHLFQAFQQAALELLRGDPELAELAEAALANYPPSAAPDPLARPAAEGAERWLEEPTFFSELAVRPELRAVIWPNPDSALDARAAARERELRRQLVATVARLGHGFVDLWILAVRRLGTLRLGAREEEGEASGLIPDYLDLLDRQRSTGGPEFSSLRELELVARHHSLLLDVNFPELRTILVHEAPRVLGQHLGRQRPIGGMFGAVNRTLVRQFRMPGYPFVLFTTDLLQEGEDLHTFCSEVYHYGISWMPSSMEQRVGRVDRVNSHSERRLSGLDHALAGEEKLQVFYPYLADTVEVLQVWRVLERLNRFMRLMHRDLGAPEDQEKKVHLSNDLLRVYWDIAPITQPLTSAFPIREDLLEAPARALAVEPGLAASWLARFRALVAKPWPGIRIEWEPRSPEDAPLGVARLGLRQQPLTLQLLSLHGHIVLRCVSPIATVSEDFDLQDFAAFSRELPISVAVSRDERRKVWHLAGEGEAILGGEEHDLERASWLVGRVMRAADRLEGILSPGKDATASELQEQLEMEGDHGD